MPQTLLALLSLMLATLFSFNQQRSILAAQSNMLQQDVSLHLTGAANDWIERLGALPFDENLGTAALTANTDLTAMVSTQNGYTFAPDLLVDDIDDYDDQTFVVSRAVLSDTLDIQLSIDVTYVDEINQTQAVTYPTKYKRATITAVTSETLARDNEVSLNMIFSCGSRCDW